MLDVTYKKKVGFKTLTPSNEVVLSHATIPRSVATLNSPESHSQQNNFFIQIKTVYRMLCCIG